MAISFPQSLVLLALGLAFLSNCSADLIADVCSGANNPSLCNEVLRSAHQRDPTLSLLANIAYSPAKDQASKIKDILQSSISAATDPELKRRLNICLQNANLAVEKLNDSYNSFLVKNYTKMVIDANGSMVLERSCELSFKTPPSEPIIVKQATDRGSDLGSIIAEVGKALIKISDIA